MAGSPSGALRQHATLSGSLVCASGPDRDSQAQTCTIMLEIALVAYGQKSCFMYVVFIRAVNHNLTIMIN